LEVIKEEESEQKYAKISELYTMIQNMFDDGMTEEEDNNVSLMKDDNHLNVATSDNLNVATIELNVTIFEKNLC
jgi:hypothetical protein